MIATLKVNNTVSNAPVTFFNTNHPTLSCYWFFQRGTNFNLNAIDFLDPYQRIPVNSSLPIYLSIHPSAHKPVCLQLVFLRVLFFSLILHRDKNTENERIGWSVLPRKVLTYPEIENAQMCPRYNFSGFL